MLDFIVLNTAIDHRKHLIPDVKEHFFNRAVANTERESGSNVYTNLTFPTITGFLVLHLRGTRYIQVDTYILQGVIGLTVNDGVGFSYLPHQMSYGCSCFGREFHFQKQSIVHKSFPWRKSEEKILVNLHHIAQYTMCPFPGQSNRLLLLQSHTPRFVRKVFSSQLSKYTISSL